MSIRWHACIDVFVMYIRFFQKEGESTDNDIYWPIEKFNELELEIKKTLPSKLPIKLGSPETGSQNTDIFISYQLDNKELAILLGKKVS